MTHRILTAVILVTVFVAPQTASAKSRSRRAHHHRVRRHRARRHPVHPARKATARAVVLKLQAPQPAPRPLALSAAVPAPVAQGAADVPQAPVTPPPSLIGVGNVPGCMSGADPGAYLQQYGASVLRVIVTPTRGADGSALPCLQAAVAEGYRVELVMQWRDDWDDGQTLAFFQQAMPQYAPLAWAVAIGNEQDLIEGSRADTPAEYARTWQAVEPFVRATVPDATLVAGEVSPWSLDWLSQAFAVGLPGAQALASHPYVGPDTSTPAQFVAQAQSLGLPAWFDEALAGPGAWGSCVGLSAMAGAQMAAAWLG